VVTKDLQACVIEILFDKLVLNMIYECGQPLQREPLLTGHLSSLMIGDEWFVSLDGRVMRMQFNENKDKTIVQEVYQTKSILSPIVKLNKFFDPALNSELLLVTTLDKVMTSLNPQTGEIVS
jgi:hypothetical protein